MANENQTLQRARLAAAAYGQIGSVTDRSVTIEGHFPPGLPVDLNRGAEVYVFTVDQVIGLMARTPCDGCYE